MNYYLMPTYDKRQSFYGKAIVQESQGAKTLYSYLQEVAVLSPKGDVYLVGPWDYSTTTLRHVREFLRQAGKPVGNKDRLRKLYCEVKE